ESLPGDTRPAKRRSDGHLGGRAEGDDVPGGGGRPAAHLRGQAGAEQRHRVRARWRSFQGARPGRGARQGGAGARVRQERDGDRADLVRTGVLRRSLVELGRLDLALSRAIQRTRTPVLDSALARLSRAANYSRLSLAAAGLLALTGGPR